MIEPIIASILLIGAAVALLCVKLLFRRNGSFSSMHIGDSEAMKERGIHCVIEQDREQRTKTNKH